MSRTRKPEELEEEEGEGKKRTKQRNKPAKKDARWRKRHEGKVNSTRGEGW